MHIISFLCHDVWTLSFSSQTSSTNHEENFQKREKATDSKQDDIEDRIPLFFIPEPCESAGKTNEHGWVYGESIKRVIVENEVVEHEPEEDDSWEAGEDDRGCNVVIHLDGVFEDNSKVQKGGVCCPRSEQS